jgi:hypothetical protein
MGALLLGRRHLLLELVLTRGAEGGRRGQSASGLLALGRILVGAALVVIVLLASHGARLL